MRLHRFVWILWYTNVGIKKFLGDGDALHRELVSLNLVSTHLQQAAHVVKKRVVKAKAKRKQSTRVSNNTSSYGVNAHIKGTALEKVILEARAKALREEQNQ